MSFTLGKLRIGRPVPKDPEGRMTLVEHLAELRSRLIKAVLAIVLGMVVAWIFYDPLFHLLYDPFEAVVSRLERERHFEAGLNMAGVASALMMQIKISLTAGLIVSCPVWLYQIWAFIMPGLHNNERKWSMVFIGTAAPLFLSGVLLGYFAMPKGLGVLFDFTPNLDRVQNLINLEEYLNFTIRLLVVFGIAFLIPIFVIMLNLVGVLSVERIKKLRAPIIFGIFVFSAIATPSTDPVTMLILAFPMMFLFLASEIIARFIERRRRDRLKAQGIDLEAIQNAGKDDD